MTKRTRRRPETHSNQTVAVYSDRLLRASVVVQTPDSLWLVPRAADGWQRRQRLTMTDAARSDRLRAVTDISPGWLGIPEGANAKNECETGPRMNERSTG